ncbi:MAG: hypothetical protein HQL37_09325 [Alphaproteobacteria bacterium]|nr:hypothetical protein [Alphaproteobacteria bacterium]
MRNPAVGEKLGLPPEPAWGDAPDPLYFYKKKEVRSLAPGGVWGGSPSAQRPD